MDNVIWNALILIVPMILGWLVGRYLTPKIKPYLNENPEIKGIVNLVYGYIDNYMEVLKKKYPDAKWDDLLDKSIDKIAKEIGLNPIIPIDEKEVKKRAEKKFLGLI